MRVAIVIPVLDEATGIAGTLAALQPLRAAGHRVVVADGGSRDRTAEIAAPLCDCVVRASRGRARQMNAGAAAMDETAAGHGAITASNAGGPVTIDAYLFLHADTQLPADALDMVVAALQDGARWGRFDVEISGQSRWLPVIATLMNLRSRLTGIATGDQAIFVERAAFDAVGGFPEWPLMEDIGISCELKKLSPPAALRARVVTSGRRWDTRGPLRTIALMWWLRLRFALGARPEALAARYATVR